MSEGLKERTITGLAIGIPIMFLVFFNDTTRIIFLSLLLITTLIEYFGLHYKPITKYTVFLVGSLIACALIGWAAYMGLFPYLIIGLGIVSSIVLLLDLLVTPIVKRAKAFTWIQNLFYTTIPISCLLLFHSESYFKELLIGTLFLVWISDISAYFVGKSIGKHKLMPSISPGKTREGFFGAGMVTILSSYLMFNFLGKFSFQQWVVIALLVWLIGSAGDLVESKMKRQLKIKDSSDIFPGHGGFLDRFDGFIFCLPAVTLFVYLIEKL